MNQLAVMMYTHTFIYLERDLSKLGSVVRLGTKRFDLWDEIRNLETGIEQLWH